MPYSLRTCTLDQTGTIGSMRGAGLAADRLGVKAYRTAHSAGRSRVSRRETLNHASSQFRRSLVEKILKPRIRVITATPISSCARRWTTRRSMRQTEQPRPHPPRHGPGIAGWHPRICAAAVRPDDHDRPRGMGHSPLRGFWRDCFQHGRRQVAGQDGEGQPGGFQDGYDFDEAFRKPFLPAEQGSPSGNPKPRLIDSRWTFGTTAT